LGQGKLKNLGSYTGTYLDQISPAKVMKKACHLCHQA
jgi:hypothetical protein